MQRWRRLAVIGNVAAVGLCLVAILAPYFYDLGRLGLARWRWAHRGGDNYSLVVVQMCNCSHTTGLKLTVRAGQVIQVEALSRVGTTRHRPTAGRLDPAQFNHLTVEATFARAGRALINNWRLSLGGAPRNQIVYDAELGFVRRLEANDPLVPYFFYIFTARDLEFLAP
jgi:hypothetical protein